MLKFIKHNISFILGIFLLLLMYHTPESLKEFSKTMLGRAILISILSYFALFCDLACAIIFATIIIVLLHETKEGFREGGQFHGGLKKFYNKSIANADSAESKLGFNNKEGMDDHEDVDNHVDHHEGMTEADAKIASKAAEEAIMAKVTDKKDKKDEKDEKDEEDKKDKKMGFNNKEGFMGLENIKHVTEKLQNYLGFSIIDLDRFMKTSSEKNTISATKDM
jgi:hypothetical protein